MTLWEVFRFELDSQMRRPATWLYLGVLVLLAFMAVDSIMIEEAKMSGTVDANAPFLVAFCVLFIGLLGTAVTAALFGDAAARDVQTRMHPFFYTSPLRPAQYLGGRFLGALALNGLLLAAAGLALVLAEISVRSPELFGPFRLASHLMPYLVLALPSLLITGAIVFAAAALARRPMAGYGAALLLFLASLLSVELLWEQVAMRTVATLLDPFGFAALRGLIDYWTPVERNARPVGFGGMLLWNRLLWLGLAAAALAVTALRFRFAPEGGGRRRHGTASAAGEAVLERPAPVAVPRAPRSFGPGARLRQAISIAGRSFTEVVASRHALVVLAGTLIFVFVGGWNAGTFLDTPTWPVTSVIARDVFGELAPLVYVLLALYAGELVWREREAGTSELHDAAPLPGWVTLLGKLGAMVLGLILLQAVLTAAGVVLQALQGFYRFELGLYVQMLFGLQLADYLLWAILAMLVHVVAGHKYVGHLVVVLYFFFFTFARFLYGIEHNMLLYPAAPGWAHSDMSGFEPFVAPYLAFKLYWGAWALLLLVLANVLWPRGRETGVRSRLRAAGGRLTGPTRMAAAAAALLVLATGGWVFYNTNVVNEYRSRDERAALAADYERRYKRHESLPQPRVTATSLRVELYPARRAADVAGTYRLTNRTAEPIGSIHLIVPPKLETRSLRLDRAARLLAGGEEHGYHVFALDEALRPDDSLRLTFDLAFAPRGFPNSGIDRHVLANGTFFTEDVLPAVGYRPDLELKSARARREQGLPPRRPLPAADDEEARRRGPRNAEWIDFEAVIGTAEGQTAIAPGSLRRTWTEDGRRYFHYRTDVPVKNVYAVLSAEYAVRRDRWRDVEIEILHHPTHTANLDRMVRGVQETLAYCTAHFGPYRYRQVRIAEFPRHRGHFASAYPNTIANSESIGFLARPERGIDYPLLVTAHEVAHQWWGGEFAPAEVQGKRFLFETLAQYTALMVLEKTAGREPVHRFLRLMQHDYLVGRQNRSGEEAPLLLAEDQSYILYKKGAVAMYALRDVLGEERLNTALRRFLDRHRLGGAPYPTTLDLYAELQAVTPPSLRSLLVDLFEEITLWELRATGARAERTGTGEYRVTLTVDARKVQADGVGREERVPMDDPIDVGIFAAAGDGEERGEALYLRKHRIRSGQQTITVTVPREPALAGIDPDRKLIERQGEDNLVEVEVVPGEMAAAPRRRAARLGRSAS